MIGKLEDFIKNNSIIEEIINPRNKLIMAIGGSDTGKTTMVECIADLLARYSNVGIVDLDMGQSHIGPPTTIAWGKIQGGFRNWSDIKIEDFYFTGTTTPMGSLLPAVAGAKIITERAISSCEKVIVDTTGLIAEPTGRVLKQFKIDLLSPDIILALEFSKELWHILDSYNFNKSLKIYRIPAPANVKSKDITKRTQYRFEKFNAYFINAGILEISIENVGIRFIREPLRFIASDLENRIISFRDENNKDIALGIIEGIDLKDRKLMIRTPMSGETKFSTIVIGRAQLDLTINSLKNADQPT